MKVNSESEVAQSCPTLSDPMDCSLPCASIHGILQARVLEWGAVSSPSQPLRAALKEQVEDRAINNSISSTLCMLVSVIFQGSM